MYVCAQLDTAELELSQANNKVKVRSQLLGLCSVLPERRGRM